jgi:hypothetical protein
MSDECEIVSLRLAWGESSVGIGDGVIDSAVRVLSLRWGVITKHSLDEKILKLN